VHEYFERLKDFKAYFPDGNSKIITLANNEKSDERILQRIYDSRVSL
jgi:hypothetical protein